jgi:hypothetical protein
MEKINIFLLYMIFLKVYKSFFIMCINWVILRLFKKSGIRAIDRMKEKGLRSKHSDATKEYESFYLRRTPTDGVCWWAMGF